MVVRGQEVKRVDGNKKVRSVLLTNTRQYFIFCFFYFYFRRSAETDRSRSNHRIGRVHPLGAPTSIVSREAQDGCVRGSRTVSAIRIVWMLSAPSSWPNHSTDRAAHSPAERALCDSVINSSIQHYASQSDVLGVSHRDQGRVCGQLSPLAPVSFFCPNRPYLVDQVDRLLSRDASMRPGSQFSVQLRHARQPLVRLSGLRVRQRAHLARAMELVAVSQIFSVRELSARR